MGPQGSGGEHLGGPGGLQGHLGPHGWLQGGKIGTPESLGDIDMATGGYGEGLGVLESFGEHLRRGWGSLEPPERKGGGTVIPLEGLRVSDRHLGSTEGVPRALGKGWWS